MVEIKIRDMEKIECPFKRILNEKNEYGPPWIRQTEDPWIQEV